MNRVTRTPIKIAFADDHLIFRDGFKLLTKDPAIKVVGEAENGEQLLSIIEKEIPDVVFVDIKMPVLDGVDTCKTIKEKFPGIKVIALSMFNDDNLIVDMLEAGADGYLLKNTNRKEVMEAIEAVTAGEHYFCEETSDKLAKQIGASSFNPFRGKPPIQFKPRELQIINLICQEDSNKEIADKLGLSYRSVEKYRDNIREKIGARNSIGIVIYAIKQNIVRI